MSRSSAETPISSPDQRPSPRRSLGGGGGAVAHRARALVRRWLSAATEHPTGEATRGGNAAAAAGRCDVDTTKVGLHGCAAAPGTRAGTRIAGRRSLLAAAEEAHHQPDDATDQGELQEQAEEAGGTPEAVAHQHAEQAAEGEAAEQRAEEAATEHAGALGSGRGAAGLRGGTRLLRRARASSCARSGRPGRGAMLVGGGAWKVRAPRLPKEPNEPARRASAWSTTTTSVPTASRSAAATRPVRDRNLFIGPAISLVVPTARLGRLRNERCGRRVSGDRMMSDIGKRVARCESRSAGSMENPTIAKGPVR